MAVVYLEPSDLSAAQAARVLDFLNHAQSAAQLAREIEFPDERDIGVRLGKRLLDARAALGGQFSDIAQVRAVKLIGPERFTEICIAALGLPVGRWVELFFAASPMAAPAESGLELSLAATPQPLWLGQPMTVTAWVRDRSGAPRAGVPVTVHTTGGRLEYAYGMALIEGTAVTATTGADGSARLQLRTPPNEPLSREQEAALAGALERLDAQAPNPLALREAFLALAQDYGQERNYSLRKAIDVYTRQWKQTLVDSLNPGRWRLAWPRESGVVRADAHPAAGGGTSLTHAVLPLSWINWVGAWGEFLAESLRNQAQLRAAFAGAAQSGASGYGLSQRLVGAAHGFLAGQAGLSAEWLGRKVVGEAVRDYVGGSVDGMNTATQQAVISQLDVAADQLRPGSAGTLALVDLTRGDLDGRIDVVAAASTANIAEIRDIEAGINQRAAEVATHAAAVAAGRAEVAQKLDVFGAQIGDFNGKYATFAGDYSAFVVDYGKFSVDYSSFNLSYATFNTNYNLFNTNLGTFNTNFATFNVDLGTFNQNRTQLTQTISTVQADMSAVKLDVAGLKQQPVRSPTRKKGA